MPQLVFVARAQERASRRAYLGRRTGESEVRPIINRRAGAEAPLELVARLLKPLAATWRRGGLRCWRGGVEASVVRVVVRKGGQKHAIPVDVAPPPHHRPRR